MPLHLPTGLQRTSWHLTAEPHSSVALGMLARQRQRFTGHLHGCEFSFVRSSQQAALQGLTQRLGTQAELAAALWGGAQVGGQGQVRPH